MVTKEVCMVVQWVTPVASQLNVPSLDLPAWMFSSFLPQTKDMPVRLNGDSKLPS